MKNSKDPALIKLVCDMIQELWSTTGVIDVLANPPVPFERRKQIPGSKILVRRRPASEAYRMAPSKQPTLSPLQNKFPNRS